MRRPASDAVPFVLPQLRYSYSNGLQSSGSPSGASPSGGGIQDAMGNSQRPPPVVSDLDSPGFFR